MQHDIVSSAEWLAARQALLAEEKKLAELRARIVERRRALPWTAVDKAYGFDTPAGRQTLGELFGGRGRLIVYHFMCAPEWRDGCPGCSLLGGHLDGLGFTDQARVVVAAVDARADLAGQLGKLQSDPWKPSHDVQGHAVKLLHTVRGAGYVIRDK